MQSETLAAGCRGRWPEIMAQLAPFRWLLHAIDLMHERPHLLRHCPCPSHIGDHGDAFRVFPDFDETGGVVCNSCGKYPTGFEVLMWLNHWDVKQTGRELRDFLNGDRRNSPMTSQPAIVQPSGAPKKVASGAYARPSRERLQAVWEEAVALTHPAAAPVRRYFASRGLGGLNLGLLTMLRCHPRLLYFDTQRGVAVGYFPVLLAYVVGPDDVFVALHRTYLTEDGCKAPVDPVKKLWNADGVTASGGAVRLQPAGSIVCTSEGLENGLSGLLRNPDIALWPTTSAPLLGSLIVPPQVRHLVIWADLEPPKIQPDGTTKQPGRDAAAKLAERMQAEGRTSETLFPRIKGETKFDWNQVLIQYGLDAIPRLSTRIRMLPTAYRLTRLPYGTVIRTGRGA